MLNLMPEERFAQLWNSNTTPACEEGLKLAHVFLDLCGDAVDERNEANFDPQRFAFSKAWRDYTQHRLRCIKCLELR